VITSTLYRKEGKKKREGASSEILCLLSLPRKKSLPTSCGKKGGNRERVSYLGGRGKAMPLSSYRVGKGGKKDRKRRRSSKGGKRKKNPILSHP